MLQLLTSCCLHDTCSENHPWHKYCVPFPLPPLTFCVFITAHGTVGCWWTQSRSDHYFQGPSWPISWALSVSSAPISAGGSKRESVFVISNLWWLVQRVSSRLGVIWSCFDWHTHKHAIAGLVSTRSACTSLRPSEDWHHFYDCTNWILQQLRCTSSKITRGSMVFCCCAKLTRVQDGKQHAHSFCRHA